MTREQVEAIQAQIDILSQDYASDYRWGVRFDKPGLSVGHIFRPSRVWNDGKATRRTLPGTCIISVASLGVLSRFNFYPGAAYIVCGERANGADPADEGEEIVTECEIMAVL